VVLLMLIPLLAPSDTGAPTGVSTIARALGIAAVKARPPRYRVGNGAALRPPRARVLFCDVCPPHLGGRVHCPASAWQRGRGARRRSPASA